MIVVAVSALVTIFAMYVLVYYGVQNEQYSVLIRWFQWWTILIVVFIIILHKKNEIVF